MISQEALFSIVIPCRNEEKFIGKTLESISGQTAVNETTPIFIADANSTDNTLLIIKSFQQKLNIQLVEGGYPPTGRNNGAKKVTTKYIVFLDADVELGEKNSLEKILSNAEQNNLDLLSMHIKVTNANWIDTAFWKIHGTVAKYKIFGAFSTGMFIFIKREAFLRIGPFNENMHLGDDWELTRKVSRRKFKMADTFILISNRRFKKYGYLKTLYSYLMVAASKKFRNSDHRKYYDEINY